MDGFESRASRGARSGSALALREYEEEQKLPLAERISERDADS